jgi:hypothetical protein
MYNPFSTLDDQSRVLLARGVVNSTRSIELPTPQTFERMLAAGCLRCVRVCLCCLCVCVCVCVCVLVFVLFVSVCACVGRSIELPTPQTFERILAAGCLRCVCVRVQPDPSVI